MEFKDITTWSVSKGIAKPVDTRSKEDISLIIGDIELQLAKSRERIVRLKFEQFAQQHTYATDAPDGSYSADCFGDILWQFMNVKFEWTNCVSNDPSFSKAHGFSTRQFLPFIDQVKAESPKFGEWKEALLKAKSTLWSLSVGAYSYEEIRTLSRAEYNRIRLALGEIDSLPSPPKTR